MPQSVGSSVRKLTAASLLAILILNVGCTGGQSGLHPVHGKLLYKDQPIAGAFISFHPKNADPKALTSTGSTKEDGTFELTTGMDQGAPPGQYDVTVVWLQDAAGSKKKAIGTNMNPDVQTVDKLKGRYSDLKRPAFTDVTIKSGPNQLADFKLQ